MEVKFNPKIHNRKSVRLIAHDYGEPGLYFITICSKSRKNLFGKIINYEMILSDIGKIIQKEWEATKNIRSNVDLDEYIVMPNHLHGIIEIKYNRRGVWQYAPTDENHQRRGVLPYAPTNENKFQSPSHTLGSIVRGFKASATKQVNKYLNSPDAGPIWQRNYHDHIIANENSYNKIADYVYNNPASWESDLNNLNFINKVPIKEREKLIQEHYADLFGVT